MTANLDRFLITIDVMHRSKAHAALTKWVKADCGTVSQRYDLIEARLLGGANIQPTKRLGKVLMNPDGSFLDAENITLTGIKYAEFLKQTGE